MFVTDNKLADFYANLGQVARKARIAIEEGDYTYLPHNPSPLTELKKADPKLEHKIAICVEKVEEKVCPSDFVSYAQCKVNPVAVCKASVKPH